MNRVRSGRAGRRPANRRARVPGLRCARGRPGAGRRDGDPRPRRPREASASLRLGRSRHRVLRRRRWACPAGCAREQNLAAMSCVAIRHAPEGLLVRARSVAFAGTIGRGDPES